jgi:hypothetical protein
MPFRIPVAGHLIMVITDAAERSWLLRASTTCVWLSLWLLQPGLVSAQPSAAEPSVGLNAGATHGLVYTEQPLARPDHSEGIDLTLAASAGYGVTERIRPATGAQHRAQGTLAAAVAPLPWLSVALRFDGRIEAHPHDDRSAYVTAFGDPRLAVRAGYALNPKLSLGAELLAWFPGADAPSLKAAATSLDGRLLGAYASDGWSLLAAAGARWDNSRKLGLDRSRLRVSDRITFGISDSNALLFALGAARRVDAWEVFGELSADALIGARAPSFVRSPLRAAVGARYTVTHALQLELTTLTSLSRRPKIAVSQPWAPIEPRFAIWAGVRYAFELQRPPRPSAAKPERAPNSEPSASAGEPVLASVSGVITDDHGEPLPEVRVKLKSGDAAEREGITNAQGRYSFAAVRLGAAELEASAVGFATQAWRVEIKTLDAEQPTRGLTPKATTGIVRGLVRSFESRPLRAHVVVRNLRGKTITEADSNAEGRVEIELEPGRYHVTIDVPGYKSHVQTIRVKGNDVSVLNADLRKQP